MSFASRIVLRSPISNPAALEPFVEGCIRDKVILIAIAGEGCGLLENLIDEIIVGDGYDDDRFIVTTSHPDEPFEDVSNSHPCSGNVQTRTCR